MIVKLSPTRWLNLATVIEIEEDNGRLTVITALCSADRFGQVSPWTLHLEGDERLALLTWLALGAGGQHV
jgi:hypothetical protein